MNWIFECFVGCSGIALFVIALLLRPEGKPITWGWSFGFLQNSTALGKLVGLIGIGLATFGYLSFLPELLEIWTDERNVRVRFEFRSVGGWWTVVSAAVLVALCIFVWIRATRRAREHR